MTADSRIKAPYHIAFAGALLSVAEAASDFVFHEYWASQSPFEVSETQLMISAAIGLIIALAISSYLYYHHRNEDLEKDSFLYVIIAALIGLLIGGQLASIITLIGAFVCYKRL
jgi:prolipoprotein diacylglyceryltransferase